MPSFAAGLDLCRRMIRRGATPAVLRLYDGIESDRNYDVGTDRNVVIVLDEGDRARRRRGVRGRRGGSRRTPTGSPASGWTTRSSSTGWRKRNDVAALEQLITGGLVVDTMEISGPWSALPRVYDAALSRHGGGRRHAGGLRALQPQLPGRRLPLLHLRRQARPSATRTTDRPPAIDRYYRDVWDAGTRAVLAAGGSLSHHHGVGLNRAPLRRRGTGRRRRRAGRAQGDPRPQRASSTPASSACRRRFGDVDLP